MKLRNMPREHGWPGCPKWLLIAVVAVLVTAFTLNPATPTPARADCVGDSTVCLGGGTGSAPPAILLNPDQIAGNGQYAGNIYNATPAQLKSLDNLQVQAIQNMLNGARSAVERLHSSRDVGPRRCPGRPLGVDPAGPPSPRDVQQRPDAGEGLSQHRPAERRRLVDHRLQE